MAKQARRPSGQDPRRTEARQRTGSPQTAAQPAAPRPAANPPQPERRSTYIEAVGIYEQALRTLQQHNYVKAADLLRHVITSFPEERELVERSRVYLNLCERQLQPLTAEPQNTAERLYAATLAINAGKPEEATAHLDHVLRVEPTHEQALYMMAVAASQRHQSADAIRYLQQAIEANPENRALARMDPDLEALRHDDGVKALLEPPPAIRTADSRRPFRRK